MSLSLVGEQDHFLGASRELLGLLGVVTRCFGRDKLIIFPY